MMTLLTHIQLLNSKGYSYNLRSKDMAVQLQDSECTHVQPASFWCTYKLIGLFSQSLPWCKTQWMAHDPQWSLLKCLHTPHPDCQHLNTWVLALICFPFKHCWDLKKCMFTSTQNLLRRRRFSRLRGSGHFSAYHLFFSLLTWKKKSNSYR